jgi:argininosuccinate synthase
MNDNKRKDKDTNTAMSKGSRVVVAFSGGLDTSYTVMRLANEGWAV